MCPDDTASIHMILIFIVQNLKASCMVESPCMVGKAQWLVAAQAARSWNTRQHTAKSRCGGLKTGDRRLVFSCSMCRYHGFEWENDWGLWNLVKHCETLSCNPGRWHAFRGDKGPLVRQPRLVTPSEGSHHRTPMPMVPVPHRAIVLREWKVDETLMTMEARWSKQYS